MINYTQVVVKIEQIIASRASRDSFRIAPKVFKFFVDNRRRMAYYCVVYEGETAYRY